MTTLLDGGHTVTEFRFCRWRFAFVAEAPIQFSGAANVFRGGLGRALYEVASEAEYTRIFAPKMEDGPSGLADPPRPFVLRVRSVPAKVDASSEFAVGVHYFDVRRPALTLFTNAFANFADRLGARLDRVYEETLRVPMPRPASVPAVRVTFVTPTELKPAGHSFGVLYARARDRVSTLSALYGDGPLDVDFRESGERADRVRTRESALETVHETRRSGRTGQTHGIGGFVGHAVYEGEVGEFLPVLRAAAATGVGRQTVWGKGEIDVEPLLE